MPTAAEVDLCVEALDVPEPIKDGGSQELLGPLPWVSAERKRTVRERLPGLLQPERSTVGLQRLECPAMEFDMDLVEGSWTGVTESQAPRTKVLGVLIGHGRAL